MRFNALAEFYLKAEHGADAVREKSATTVPIVEHYVRDYLIARWGDSIAEDIPPIEIQRWLVSLHNDNGLAWTTVSKIRGLMLRTYKIGRRHGYVDKNPIEHTECRSTTNYKAIIVTPAQTSRSIAYMQLASVSYADGSQWNYTGDKTCLVIPLSLLGDGR